jgi:predicted  nucleic acid-binding Zn-ribbon protein
MSRTDIDFKIGADMKQFRTAMGSIDHSLKKLSGGFGALGGVIGASFAVDIIQQFVSESVELASKMEGVEAAFNRLNDPNLLDNLTKATAGTVDDLKLMQTAVKAENFRIPMDVLAKGLDFAQRRAQATGESVDYMVDSFVTGLGRESVKILDNLGISTIELNAKTKELGSMAEAVGQIMDEEFKKVGERVTTTSMKVDQQRASITNLKTEIGEKLLPVYSAFLDNTNKGLGKINFILDDQEKGYKRLFVAVQSYFNITKFGLDLVTNPTKALLSLLGNTKEEVEELNTEFDKGLPSITAWADKFDAMQTQADEGAKKQKEAVEQYNNKLEKLLPTLQRVGYEIDRAFNPGEDTSGKLAHQLGFAEVNTELEELEDTVEEFGGAYKKTFDEMVEGFFNFEEATEEAADTFDHSFRNTIDKFREFRDEFLMVGDILRMSFEAAFAPLEEGETRLGNFREAFVQQLKMMAAQLLATAAAALILATILTVAFGGTNMAGQAMFGKAGMGFGDLFGGLLQGGGGFGFNGSGMTGNTSGGIEVFGKLLGSDILLSGERAGRNRNRLSGIGG